jgi:two-component sensor histidine kinase
VELERRRDEVRVIVGDDGVGISGNLLDSARLGLQIVRSLISELNGRVAIESDAGTRIELVVPASR